ncbi:MAG: helix-turn-helix transcriptional regulator [Succiniclasticum sp.]|uniref:helix-turn-helix transcriptional regulator n=1 Tax=Succiniclasticum sp. TaxID=2775030 RepID=UPI001B1514EF|nr:helix-turn-helix transcriptional regulator [Succiniclasticum sp.]MBO5636637.1 helix-turn-helix transcriptional regulator [Acidaminococcaceae bacterium]MDY6290147.1 helix-turn-helix transcriptional regulator [Succiniclasticum sp.]
MANKEMQADNEIGKQIKMMRVQACLTQAAAARKVGVSQITFSKWENGQSHPSPDHWRKICRVLHIPLDGTAQSRDVVHPAQAKEYQIAVVENSAMCSRCKGIMVSMIQGWYAMDGM